MFSLKPHLNQQPHQAELVSTIIDTSGLRSKQKNNSRRKKVQRLRLQKNKQKCQQGFKEKLSLSSQ